MFFLPPGFLSVRVMIEAKQDQNPQRQLQLDRQYNTDKNTFCYVYCLVVRTVSFGLYSCSEWIAMIVAHVQFTSQGDVHTGLVSPRMEGLY